MICIITAQFFLPKHIYKKYKTHLFAKHIFNILSHIYKSHRNTKLLHGVFGVFLVDEWTDM